MESKSLISVVITIVILFGGIYIFSDYFGLDAFNKGDIKFSKIVTDSRRNIPIEASFTSGKMLNLNFDFTQKHQNIVFEFVPTSVIKINNQNIKSHSDGITVSMSNFSGNVFVANGSAQLKGNGDSVRFSDYEFTGRNSVELEGEIIRLKLENVQGTFKFMDVTGTFDLITNQSVQSFAMQDKNVELVNYLGSFDIVGSDGVDIKGYIAKLVTPEFTISKDY